MSGDQPHFLWAVSLVEQFCSGTSQGYSCLVLVSTAAVSLVWKDDTNRELMIQCLLFQDEAQFEQLFQEASFKSYIFKLRAKMETYNVSKHNVLCEVMQLIYLTVFVLNVH